MVGGRGEPRKHDIQKEKWVLLHQMDIFLLLETSF